MYGLFAGHRLTIRRSSYLCGFIRSNGLSLFFSFDVQVETFCNHWWFCFVFLNYSPETKYLEQAECRSFKSSWEGCWAEDWGTEDFRESKVQLSSLKRTYRWRWPSKEWKFNFYFFWLTILIFIILLTKYSTYKIYSKNNIICSCICSPVRR